MLLQGNPQRQYILYLSNKYSVPLGTYRPGKQLSLAIEAGTIVLTDPANSQVVATHKLNPGKGQLIQNKNHLRDHSSKISGLQAHVLGLLEESTEASLLLDMIRKDKPRYARDQFLLIQDVSSLTTVDLPVADRPVSKTRFMAASGLSLEFVRPKLLVYFLDKIAKISAPVILL